MLASPSIRLGAGQQKDQGIPSESCFHLPAAHQAQPLEESLAVCKLHEACSQGTTRYRQVSDVYQVNTLSNLVQCWIYSQSAKVSEYTEAICHLLGGFTVGLGSSWWTQQSSQGQSRLGFGLIVGGFIQKSGCLSPIQEDISYPNPTQFSFSLCISSIFRA